MLNIPFVNDVVYDSNMFSGYTTIVNLGNGSYAHLNWLLIKFFEINLVEKTWTNY